MSNTMKTIDEIVHNIYIGYYLDNGGEEAAVAAIEVYKDNACNEARIDELENRLRIQFISSHWKRLCAETNSWAKYVDRRISELQAERNNLNKSKGANYDIQ